MNPLQALYEAASHRDAGSSFSDIRDWKDRGDLLHARGTSSPGGLHASVCQPREQLHGET